MEKSLRPLRREEDTHTHNEGWLSLIASSASPTDHPHIHMYTRIRWKCQEQRRDKREAEAERQKKGTQGRKTNKAQCPDFETV